jgi:Ala-tRNA(Pro) deacylase
MQDPTSVYDRLVALLVRNGVAYTTFEHPPVFTSEEAARVRGTTLESGAKALICSVDGAFAMFVLPGNRRLDSKGVRRALGAKSLRFATREEVEALTSLAPGAIPPFGQLFGLPTRCDTALAAQPSINFNAGDHARSVGISFADYLAVEKPVLAAISVGPAEG